MRVLHDSDLTLFSRFECKYVVDRQQLPELRAFISPFMRPDRFAALHDDRRYPVCSLYLDSDDLALYQQTVNGERDRFKLRARTYSDRPDSPVFLEIKRKVNNVVQKRRARVDRATARHVMNHELHRVQGGGLEPGAARDIEHFADRARRLEAKPVLRVKYMREAYESDAGDPVRITVDTDLCHAVSLDGALDHGPGRWVSTPVDGVIVEIKFTERFPTWVSDLVRMLALKQQPVPKYILSVDHMLMTGREASLAVAGFTLPARRF